MPKNFWGQVLILEFLYIKNVSQGGNEQEKTTDEVIYIIPYEELKKAYLELLNFFSSRDYFFRQRIG